jgi:hypothetical protein
MTKQPVCGNVPALPRRSFLAALPAALAAPAIAQASPHNEDLALDSMILIAERTGYSLDDVHQWFRGLHSDVVVQIAENTQSTDRDPYQLIGYHARSTMRLLTETAPKEFKAPDTFFIVGERFVSSCYPQNYKTGEKHAAYESGKGWFYSN